MKLGDFVGGSVISRRILAWLVIAALVLPIALSVTVAAARLLAAMQDAAGSAALDRVALVLGIVWVVDLVCLVISVALALIESSKLAALDDAEASHRQPPDADL